jgi:hypothetical protein
MSRDELLAAVACLMSGGAGTDEANAILMVRVKRSVPHPRVQDLMFHSSPALSPEEVVEEALAYRPLEL